MEHDPEIVWADAELCAYVVFRLLFEKDGGQNCPFAVAPLTDDAADALAALFFDQLVLARFRCDQLHEVRVIDRLDAFLPAYPFENDVVAHPGNVRAEAVPVADPAASGSTQRFDDAKERLLYDVVGRLRRAQPTAHFDPQNGREIRDEMLLGPTIALPQTADVVVVEGKEVHDVGSD